MKGEEAATNSNYAQTAQHKLVKQNWDKTMTTAEKEQLDEVIKETKKIKECK